jgi:PKD repeat protein
MNIKLISKSTMWLLCAGFLAFTTSCEEAEEPSLGNPPSQADAAFTFQASANSDNIIEFTASNSNLDATWDFGNGATGSGSMASATYPFAGTYTVTLTVQNSGGSASSTQDVVIAQDDPTLVSNPLFDILSGGASKTWAVDSNGAAHFGVGPEPLGAAGKFPEFYAAAPLEKSGGGMYDDRYTFKSQGFGFDMVTNGDVYVNADHAGNAPFDDSTSVQVGDFNVKYPDQLGTTWTLSIGADTTLTIGGGAFLGYWAGTRTYQIVTINENELFLRYVDAINTNLAWYIRLIPEGAGNPPPPPPPTYSLPLNFENEDPVWTPFGGNTYQIINNPDATGINTSTRVLETTHGNQPWAGLSVALDNPLDFSTQTTIKFKIWAPATGTVRFKLEEADDNSSFVEIDAMVTTANTWQEVTFDLTGEAAIYDLLSIFPGWQTTTPDVYYIDDIVQE